MAEIVLDAVTKRYPDGTEAVRDLDLQVADGELLILVGPSGCGKTTALRMVAGLEDISAGELRIAGEVVNDRPAKDRDIAMVFQNYALYPHMSVRQNMGFSLKLAKVPKAEIDRRVSQVAHVLDLEQHLDRKPASLSGGQRQRVAMGRAIVREPKAFLMDEPLSNLDAKLRVQTRAEVARLQARLGTTTIYVTHDQTEAMTLGDRVAVMRLGDLHQIGTPKELYDDPVDLFVAGFIGSPSMNFLPATLEGSALRTPVGTIALADGTRRRLQEQPATGRDVIVGVRPEHFEDARMVDERRHGYVFDATIELVESMGSEIYAYFSYEGEVARADQLGELEADAGADEVPGATGQQVIARLDASSDVHRGGRARLWLDTVRLHVFDPRTGRNLTRASA